MSECHPRYRRCPIGFLKAAAAVAWIVCGASPNFIPAARAQVRVTLGTLAPTGSSFHRALLEMGEKWREATGGAVRLTIFPDGRMGGEANMVRKMRAGQLNAGALTVVGLSDIDRSVTCLQYMPMMFRSWEEVDYVRENIALQLEKRLADKGLVVLAWGDAGWVRFITKTPVMRPHELKSLKLFAWAGDTFQVDMMKDLGYQPIPLETADILPGLQTGLISAAAVTPYFALAGQCDGPAPHMLAVNWVPIVGAVLIRRDAWDRLPPGSIDKVKQAAAVAGQKIRASSRKENDEAVEAMQKRGLKVQVATPELEAEWRSFAEAVYPKIRGRLVPEDLFDEVRRLLSQYRNAPKGNVR
jgi:TRAP-type transport system periplasmic protein